MNRDELRDETEDELRDAFLDTYKPRKHAMEVWGVLAANFDVNGALEDYPKKKDEKYAVQYLRQKAREWKRQARVFETVMPGRPVTPDAPLHGIPIPLAERQRADSLRRWIVRKAGARESVRHFRETVLDGPLTAIEAHQFVTSPATSCMQPEEFRKTDALHRCTGILSWDERRDLHRWEGTCTLVLDPPKEEHEIRAIWELPIGVQLPSL